jgi:glucose-1-phosphate thymidylyltransferase
MKVLILAAGYGTRLYPYIKDLPKPLLKIGKRTIIDCLVNKIDELNNVSRIVVITNDRFFKQFQDWKESLNIRNQIYLVNDLTTNPQERLGAIGDMHLAFSKEGYNDDFLVLGGDNIFKDSLRDFIDFAKSKPNCVIIGLCYVKNKQEARHYGVVSLNRENQVIEFCEKPAKPKSNLVAMCLYYFPKEKLQLMKDYVNDSTNSRDTAGSYINWLINRDKVYGFIFKNLWFDVGHIHTYKKVERAFE